MTEKHVAGSILGTAAGDAIGLPYEGLSHRRAARLFGPPDRHRLFFGRGMVSDDTEHNCMVAQALIASGNDVDAFRRSLASRFRFWLLGLPAGVGMATARSILRLWIGFPATSSGVFSAGNGPSMRAAILGAAIDDPRKLREFVRASSRMTHTDPKAEYGAYAVAVAAQMAREAASVSAKHYLERLQSGLAGEGDDLVSLLNAAAAAAQKGDTTITFANSLGLVRGVSGYVPHSVPVAIHAWLAYTDDFRLAAESVIQCGGDTDSTAAIVGGIVGVRVGKEGVPEAWLTKLIEWPRSVSSMERLGTQLAECLQNETKARPLTLSAWELLLRNIFFLFVVLYHGFLRLFPSY